jgi:hypothetical protein
MPAFFNSLLEVASLYEVGSDYVPPWPTADVPRYSGKTPQG